MNIEQQKDFYNKYWQELKPLSTYKIKRVQWILMQLLSTRLKYEQPITLLDMGCGDGRLTPLWQSVTAGEAHGIELSPAAMEQAKQSFPFIHFKTGDATNTKYDKELFDIIICQEVIEHIEEQHKLATECARIMKPGGTLILTTPNKYYFDRREGGNYSNQPIENIIDKQQLIALLQPLFDIKSYETLIYARGDKGIYKWFTNRYWLALMSKAGLLEKWKDRLLKHGYGLHMAIIATKR